MKDKKEKTKGQLIKEVAELRRQIAELKKLRIERKQTEEELRKHRVHLEEQVEERTVELDLVFNNAAHGMIVIDKDFDLVRINETYAKMFGIDVKEAIGRKCYDVLKMPHCHTSACPITRILSGEKRVEFDFEKELEDGRKLFCIKTAAPLFSAEGELIKILEDVKDITERKQAEEKLKQMLVNLERSNKELEQFAYIASHDLQEPLRMVASFTQLLEKRYKGKLDADADEYIKFAVDGANCMQRLINDLLTYSRIGTREKPFEPCDCQSVLGQVIVNLKSMIDENHALITNDDLPIIAADETQMVQLFQNLIGNAIKFRRKEPPRIHVSVAEKTNEWQFSVRDNGIGIDQQYKERIFVIFQRLHSKDEFTGTGIGLAICKKIVERHGGKIWVESEPGKGSIFYFTIPKRLFTGMAK